MLSCQFEKNSVDGKKRIIQAPTQEQKSSHEKCTFAENEVYGVDVLISSHTDGKVEPTQRILIVVVTDSYISSTVQDRRGQDNRLPAHQRRHLPAEAKDFSGGNG